MIYWQAAKYLEGFIGKIIFDAKASPDPLKRMRTLLSLLDNPQNKFKSVLVGGTSGKGSTAYLLSHILKTAGYKTGLTLSPHLQRVNERLQVNGREITDKKFARLVELVIPAIEKMKRLEIGAPSYFEILVAMVFVYFAREKVDVAVVEVGMGGEFDATNTLHPLISILTNVSLDHTNILGNTVEEIAGTKVGIIKDRGLISHSSLILNHLVVVSGVKQATVVGIVEEKCRLVGAELKLLWRDFGYKIKKKDGIGIDFDFISHEDNLDDLDFALSGHYQAENASLAIKTILELRKLSFKITNKAIRKALETTFFPGRFEVKRKKFRNRKLKIVLDGAHNPTKMKEFLKSLKKIYSREKKIFIIGFKFDKDIKEMLREIVSVADEIIVTEFKAKTDTKIHASANVREIKSLIKKIKYRGKVTVEKDSGKALKKALNLMTQLPNVPIIVVTGSLYLVGEIRNML